MEASAKLSPPVLLLPASICFAGVLTLPSPIPAADDTAFSNADLRPVPVAARTWTQGDMAALWIGMAVCIPTYQLASSLIGDGMSWWQALLTVLLGNLIVLAPMALNAHAGTAYGIPFPVLLRSSFGIRGSNVAALMRAVVACGWFGVQTWIGGSALYGIAVTLGWLDPTAWPVVGWLGITLPQFGCFFLFWLLNIAVILRGIDCIRWLEGWGAPFLLIVGLALLIWAYLAADGFGPLFADQHELTTWSTFLPVFLPSLTAMVGFWGTLALNIPDFSRYARSQRDQILGQAIGLPGTMALFSFIGIAVTSATVIVYGEAIWDPVQLLGKFPAWAAVLGQVALMVATLTTNIAANVVSPANDFANVAPRWIGFKTGGVLTGLIGMVMFPWEILRDPHAYVITFLVGYSALLGPIGGIMIADYWVIRKRKLIVDDLYRLDGAYGYRGGFSLVAIGVLALAIAPSLPGFFAQFGLTQPGWFFSAYYEASWFSGFFVAFVLYVLARRRWPHL